jgi:hypothetical protein
MLGGRERRHVDADLGEDRLSIAGLDAWVRGEQLDRRREGRIRVPVICESTPTRSSGKSMWPKIAPIQSV